MVQQAYIHRLALGRSAWEPPVQPESGSYETTTPAAQGRASNFIENFTDEDSSDEVTHSDYVQIYNARGYPQNPASRALSRRIIRAYNEVLETVGVCAKHDGKIIPIRSPILFTAEQDEAIVDENETGFWLDFVQEILTATMTTVFFNLRRRIITFGYYSGIPLKHIIRSEFLRQGFISFFLAGEAAGLLTDLLQTLLPTLIEVGSEITQAEISNKQEDKSRLRLPIKLVRWTERILQCAVPCVLLPLHFHSGLQRLGLIPFWPLLPNPFSRTYFMSVFPRPPQVWDRPSFLSWIVSLALSPTITYILMYTVTTKVVGRIQRYSNAALPRPDNPDSLSLRIIQSEEFGEAARVSTYDTFQCTFQENIAKDFESVQQVWQGLYSRCHQALRGLGLLKKVHLAPDVTTSTDMEAEVSHTLSMDSEQTLEVGIILTAPVSDNINLEEISITPTESSSVANPASPLLTPSSASIIEDDEEDEEANTSNVRVRTRNGSTSTIHMDVEFNSIDTSDGQPYTSSFAASSNRPTTIEKTSGGLLTKPLHRVTGLSLHGVDSLSSLFVRNIVSIIRLPLESLYLRSLARTFLLRRSQPSWLLQEVYPMDIWFGHGLHAEPSSIWDYSSKILVCISFETLMGFQVWRIGSQIALLWGKRCYGWGQL